LVEILSFSFSINGIVFVFQDKVFDQYGSAVSDYKILHEIAVKLLEIAYKRTLPHCVECKNPK